MAYCTTLRIWNINPHKKQNYHERTGNFKASIWIQFRQFQPEKARDLGGGEIAPGLLGGRRDGASRLPRSGSDFVAMIESCRLQKISISII